MFGAPTVAELEDPALRPGTGPPDAATTAA